MTEAITGGCQCGKVRYAFSETPQTEFCHCRMCQRATGGLFAALTAAPKGAFRWTAGVPAWFRSSTVAQRPFCRDCGTPLGFAYDDPDRRMNVTIGSLDDPEVAGPNRGHYASESRVRWAPICDDAPCERHDENAQSPTVGDGYRSFQAGG